MNDPLYQRERMVEELERKRGIRDPRVLAAMREIPRHLFVPEGLAAQAYRDFALPIGEQQTISQPYVVARMTEHLATEPGHSVLELGTGSGYQTAILARLCRVVYSVERVASLAQEAIARIRSLGFHNVKIHILDGTLGWSDAAPFDRILVTAGAPKVPPRLLEQLAEGGRLVIPEGERDLQHLRVYSRVGGKIALRQEEAVSFVPLIGRDGWQAESVR